MILQGTIDLKWVEMYLSLSVLTQVHQYEHKGCLWFTHFLTNHVSATLLHKHSKCYRLPYILSAKYRSLQVYSNIQKIFF